MAMRPQKVCKWSKIAPFSHQVALAEQSVEATQHYTQHFDCQLIRLSTGIFFFKPA